MSEPKRYTAQEMREMAEHLISDISDIDDDCNVYRNKQGSFSMLDCELALQQAAEMIERCVKMRDKYGCWYGRNDDEVDAIIDTVDFIQLGREN